MSGPMSGPISVQISVERDSSVVVAAPRGDIENGSARALREKLLAALTEHHPTTLVVDLSQVRFLDSAGLGVLAAVGRRAALLGCGFSLAEPSTTVVRLLKATSLDRAWPIHPTVPAALSAAQDTDDRT